MGARCAAGAPPRSCDLLVVRRVWVHCWAGFLPPPGTGPSLGPGPMPYASPDRTRRPGSRPPLVRAQEAIIPIEHDAPSLAVLGLSDRGYAGFGRSLRALAHIL